MKLVARHRSLTLASAALAITGVMLVPAGSASAADTGGATAAAATPRITVTPHTDLADGEIVKITGSDFPGDAEMAASECKNPGPTAVSDCSLGVSALFRSNENGTFAISFEVARFIRIGGTEEVDCAKPGACRLGAATYPGVKRAHDSVTLAFNAKRKPLGPSIAVSPSSSLAPNETVAVTGHGFLPNSFVDVSECTASGECDIVTGRSEPVSATGRLSADFRASSKVLVFGPAPAGGERAVSCEHGAGCVIEVQGGSRLRDELRVKIGLDAKKAPIVPTIALSARSGLADGQIITVSGGGFPALEPVDVVECPAGEFPASCALIDAATSTADAAGSVSMQLAVTETSGAGKGAADCAVKSCVVIITDANDEWFSSAVTIGFNSSLPRVTPSLAVSPSTSLVGGELVSVTGSAFAAGSPVFVVECLRGSSPEACEGIAEGPAITADASGAFTEGLQVETTLNNGPSCGTGAGRCRVLAFNSLDKKEWVSERISFASSG
ncbi:MAG: neocarzinostatin apoprotein domain-containing protein [Acidimicrobiales bacterium]